MPQPGHTTGVYLTLKDLSGDPSLLNRLPPGLAQRYHVLPVAEDGGRITVAMADPTDREAREAVIAALMPQVGEASDAPSVFFVQGDQVAIDAALAEAWPATKAHDGDVLVCVPVARPGTGEDVTLAYATALSAILCARLVQSNDADGNEPARKPPGSAMLAVVAWDEVPLMSRGLAASKAIAPDALLIVREPRWPLHRLLAVIRGDDVDMAAIDWVVRLAGPSQVAVTVLAVAPVAAHVRAEEGMPALLTARTALGRHMRVAAQRLAAMKVEGRVHLCQGAAGLEIERELHEAEYDLLVVGTKAEGRTAFWRAGQLIEALLPNANCPMLIVKRPGRGAEPLTGS